MRPRATTRSARSAAELSIIDGAVIEVTAKRTPAEERVADGRRSVRFAREAHESLMEPGTEIIHEGARPSLANLTTMVSCVATNLTFYVIELSDSLDSLASHDKATSDDGVPRGDEVMMFFGRNRGAG